MGTNRTTLPGSQSELRSVVITSIEFDSPAGETYTNAFKPMVNAYAESITLKVGPDPSIAEIVLPVAKGTAEFGGIFDHKVYTVFGGKAQLTAFGPDIPSSSQLRLYSKIRIKGAFKTPKPDISANNPGAFTHILFIGYVTSMENMVQGKDYSLFRLHCEDVRHLLKKNPVQGVLHYNDVEHLTSSDGRAITWIRDSEIVFNEKQLPNRRFTPGNGTDTLTPVFCRTDLNRFIDDATDTTNNGMRIHDDFIFDAAKLAKIKIPFANKWYPGHAWNYIRNLVDAKHMQGADKIYTDPAGSEPTDVLPPLIDSEVDIAVLSFTDDAQAYKDWFIPRSTVGGTSQVGAAQDVSGLGEWNPTGIPVIEALFQLCRLTGNYTLACTYTDTGATLRPIRTAQAVTEGVELEIGLHGVKGVSITLPTIKSSTIRSTAGSYNVKVTGDQYFNIFHMKAGVRWVQATFSTVAKLESTDNLGQIHRAYTQASGVPAGQWLPRLNKPTLVPAWSTDDQKQWLALSTGKISFTTYPDVFSTWVVPDDIDWVNFFDLSGKEGFRRFFEKDRKLFNSLLMSSFDTTLGIFRGRRKRFPMQLWRAVRGIRTTTTGTTPYGDAETVGIKGYADWTLAEPTFTALEDGRMGFTLAQAARQDTLYTIYKPVDTAISGPSRTAWSWNALANTITLADSTKVTEAELAAYDPGNSVRSFEMMWTIPLALDEELFDMVRLKDGGMNISQFGPRMEMYRNAGNEYGTEQAIHSTFSVRDTTVRSGQEANSITMRAEPPVDSDGLTDTATEPRIYRDDVKEVEKRVQMMANRHAAPDVESMIQLKSIDPTVTAGMYVKKLNVINDKAIPIQGIVAAVHHDFQRQVTSMQLATIR